MTVTCPVCGEENPERARFCLGCGTTLVEASRPRGEERKVVSVLFVDLVDFTAASEAADPEDVRARLQTYHACAKREIERYGGTVEKFVGDAVMAVFGAPVVHEDDAERAVRAALAVLEAVEELELVARAAVNTGEAVVSLEASPERGEGIATGDVVNTAARLQSAAPPGRLVVGERTYWTTKDQIEYEPLEPVVAKGKAQPVALWLAAGARSRFGVDAEPLHRTPFFGRADELEVVRQLFARTLRERRCHLLTLVGEPGIGKSRLVAELRRHVDELPDLIGWRQGRCLPYGEGIAFWPLGEVVKAHAGILESDPNATAESKLREALDPLDLQPDERGWLEKELGRLLGLESAGPAGTPEESYAAWRAFLEAIAAQRPLVLVFEDLHWADAAFVEFLEHLVGWSTGVPVLVVVTGRPELYRQHPSWGAGTRDATTISLSPLPPEETARLVAALLEQAVLPAETQQRLLERAGGNPLYAEQFVQMLRERGDADVVVPETVQALVAARLDALDAAGKALLQDAAVVGKVFWSGAVAEIRGLAVAEVARLAHELVRRELVRPARRSSMEGQHEYAFVHAVVRDVAYSQIPRAARAQKHVAVARWLEQLGDDDGAERASHVAHHYREALALASAAGAETAELEQSARRSLRIAGARVARTDLRAVAALYGEALRLTPPGHPERGRTLLEAVEHGGGQIAVQEGSAMLEEAIDALREQGDELGVGAALLLYSVSIWTQGENARSEAVLAEAIALLEAHEPGPELAHAYALVAARDAIGGRFSEAVISGNRAVELAERVGLPEDVIRAKQFHGMGRCGVGDPRGLDDLREALDHALAVGRTRTAIAAFNNFGSMLWLIDGATAALPVYRDAVAFAERRGFADSWSQGESTWLLLDLGRWDEILEIATELAESGGQPLLMAETSKGFVLHHRGEAEQALAVARRLLPQARVAKDPQVLVPALSLTALVETDEVAAREAIDELLEHGRFDAPLYVDPALACLRLGAPELAERMIHGEGGSPRATRVFDTIRALLAEDRGDHREGVELYELAAERWAEHGCVFERARCLLGAARCRRAAGLPGATEAAREAQAVFRSLGAVRLEGEAAEAAGVAA